MRRWAVALAVTGAVAVVVIVLALVLLRPAPAGDPIRGEAPLSLTVTAAEPAPFTWAGAAHEARLLETTGASARVTFASDTPVEVTLSVGAPTAVDLTFDAVPDAIITLTSTDGGSAQLALASPTAAIWDETGFTTSGGTCPFDHHNNAADDDLTVVPDTTVSEGGFLLLYGSGDRKLNWERYDADGTQVAAPGLAAGVMEAGTGDGRVTSVDAAILDTGGADGAHPDLAVVVTTSAGTSLRLVDPVTLAGGPALHLGRALANPVVVAGSDGIAWVVAGGGYDPPQADDGLSRIVVSEVATLDGLRLERQEAVTDVAGREQDTALDAVLDPAGGTLVIAYLHRTTGEQRELRVTGVDVATLQPRWTTTVGPAAGRGAQATAAVGLEPDQGDGTGTATVVWRHDSRADGGQKLHVATVAADDGAATRVWDGPTASGSPRAQVTYPMELVPVDEGLALALFDSHAKPDAPSGSADRGRFVLWPWDTATPGWGTSAVVLDGGKPVLADVLIDLNAFEQTPTRAICGAPVALRGAVANRGSRDAVGVTLTASVDGDVVGTASLGTIYAASSTPFSVLWDVPADLAAEQVEVTYAAATSSAQYTIGNDAALHTVQVRQDGLLSGRVVNASSDLEHETGWYAGLEGARVTVGDVVALTDIAGTFSIDGLPFGTYSVTVEKDGFNPITSGVTVSRTKPLGFVAAELDNHGTVTIRVVDEAGAPLAGVGVFLHDSGERAVTPTSGEVGWDISAGTYTVSFVLRGYHPEAAREVEVVLGEDRDETITLRAATTAFLGGRVVDARGGPVAGATVTITSPAGDVVATPPVSAGGTFEPVELPAKPPTTYTVTVSGNGLTIDEDVRLLGGDDLFMTYGLVPGRGDLRIRSATEGYTSWMVKAGWPGLGEISGADMYVWYGNYAITVGTEYWEGTDELAAVDVTVWGGTYETHATASEIDFSGWFEPPDAGTVWDVTDWADVPTTLGTQHANALLGLGEGIYGLFADSDDADEWIVTGQGNELLTWAEAQSDFAPHPEFDSSDPLGSMFSVTEAVPRDFAIPIVIGGSSEQQTAVRVDQVDVVRLGPGSAVEMLGPTSEWFSFQGPVDGWENQNGKRYEVASPGVAYDDVVVYVWLTVQKLSGGDPGGTCFDQRERQVVVFHPGPQQVEGFIASGSLYRDASRMAE